MLFKVSKKVRKNSVVLLSFCLTANAFAQNECVPGKPQSNDDYQAVHWYRDSAERNALYREIFLLSEQEIKQTVKLAHLKPHQWGVILDVDETVLDNSAVQYQSVMTCQPVTEDRFSQFAMTQVSTATPGAKKFTCDIQKMGGYVTLVTNRDGSYADPITHKTLLQATVENLKKEGICYNQLILAKSVADTDKNIRFKAVETGTYAPTLMYSNVLPAHRIVAYFGDNIQDFPMFSQKEASKKEKDGAGFNSFGQRYFILPNPTYGSWGRNEFK